MTHASRCRRRTKLCRQALQSIRAYTMATTQPACSSQQHSRWQQCMATASDWCMRSRESMLWEAPGKHQPLRCTAHTRRQRHCRTVWSAAMLCKLLSMLQCVGSDVAHVSLHVLPLCMHVDAGDRLHLRCRPCTALEALPQVGVLYMSCFGKSATAAVCLRSACAATTCMLAQHMAVLRCCSGLHC